MHRWCAVLVAVMSEWALWCQCCSSFMAGAVHCAPPPPPRMRATHGVIAITSSSPSCVCVYALCHCLVSLSLSRPLPWCYVCTPLSSSPPPPPPLSSLVIIIAAVGCVSLLLSCVWLLLSWQPSSLPTHVHAATGTSVVAPTTQTWWW